MNRHPFEPFAELEISPGPLRWMRFRAPSWALLLIIGVGLCAWALLA